jgi:hypothetical protein
VKKIATLKLGLVIFDPIIVWFLTMCFVYKSQNTKKYNALEKLFIIIYKICEQKSYSVFDCTNSSVIVIYTISGIKAILQDSSVKIADDEGVSPSSSVITRVSCNML